MRISKFIFNKIMGWKVENIFPEVKKCVIAVAPHTSNWDLLIGKLAYSSIGRQANFLIKKEWFVFPLNYFFKSIGGIPINRERNTSMTDKLAKTFETYQHLHLAITPEGTRKRAENWKKGFYFIALKAQVPILLVGLDYKKKAAIFLDYFTPTGNFEEDIIKIKAYYKGLHGFHPENFAI